MNRVLLLLLFLTSFYGISSGQNLDLSLNLGSYRSPNQLNYELPRVGFNLNFSLTYQLNERWAMGTAINHASFNFNRPSMADTPLFWGMQFPTQGWVEVDYVYFTFIRKYYLPYGIRADIGLGGGMYIEDKSYYVPFRFDEEENAYRGFSTTTETIIDFHIPITYAFKKVLADKVYLGVQGGVFFDKNIRTRGLFIGPVAGIFL
ncbi:MAG: hypothetical protein ACXIUQ_13850 [Cecembia sp.]